MSNVDTSLSIADYNIKFLFLTNYVVLERYETESEFKNTLTELNLNEFEIKNLCKSIRESYNEYPIT